MTRTCLVLLGTILAMSCACNRGQGASARPKDFALLLGGIGWVFTVQLNDIPVQWNEQGGGRLPLTTAIRNGENILSIKASKCKAGPIEPFRIQVSSSPVGDATAAATVLVDLEVNPDDVPDVYSRSVSFKAEIPVRWTWQSGDRITTLADDDRQAILAQIEALDSALKARDFRAYSRLYETAITDQVKYYGKTEDIVAQMERHFRDVSGKGARVEMRKTTELAFVPLGHVVYVTGPANEARLPGGDWIMRVPNKNGKNMWWTYGPFAFARVEGKWLIVGR